MEGNKKEPINVDEKSVTGRQPIPGAKIKTLEERGLVNDGGVIVTQEEYKEKLANRDLNNE